ncbi:RmlC-like cupin [Decorospora gaudefroyi]|uniref:RmlC-like cupin n=1 Tax=Decorospora gaudefroyi TaxID=184978 RepID=A0A6A5K4T5_9PLEO|nr:RmlC-like cupin [Decorospora gaudefroyi]
MFIILKVVVAALALGTVQALPQPQAAQSSATTATSMAAPAATADQSPLFNALFTAPTAIKRYQKLLTEGTTKKLLTGDALRNAVIFPFGNSAELAPGAPGGKGEKAVSANIETFPILTGLGISTTLGFLKPCGINTPHVHPRATEFLTLVEGKNLEFGYVLENNLVGAGENPEIAGYLNQFEGTVFPQGSIHYQFNNNCDRAVFVASLTSEDPGTSQVAQNFFALNDGVVGATLGFPSSIDGDNIKMFRKHIPANLALDIEVCLKKCDMEY